MMGIVFCYFLSHELWNNLVNYLVRGSSFFLKQWENLEIIFEDNKNNFRDFPGGPVVQIPSIPDWGTKIPHASSGIAGKKRKKLYLRETALNIQHLK